MLDDATSHLKLRATWRLPKTRFLDPPRPLRGAVADLEALVGHAVALEDTSLLPHWKSPEDFPAALCVPVSSASTPLGTLWFFANRNVNSPPNRPTWPRSSPDGLVSDLEREVLLREGLRSRETDQARTLLTEWQTEQRPGMPPLIDGWQVAGRISGDESFGGQFFDWSILPDGRLAVAAGQADGMHVEASLDGHDPARRTQIPCHLSRTTPARCSNGSTRLSGPIRPAIGSPRCSTALSSRNRATRVCDRR